jgi:hypothetical protein
MMQTGNWYRYVINPTMATTTSKGKHRTHMHCSTHTARTQHLHLFFYTPRQ